MVNHFKRGDRVTWNSEAGWLGQVINVVGPDNREVYESLTPTGGSPHECNMSMSGMTSSESQVNP